MRKRVKLTEEGLKNLISKSINGIINEGMYGYPDDCDQIILAYQHDRESMELYESIIQTLLKKHKKGVNLSFDILVNSGVMKKFQQYVFRKFKQYQDTPMLRSTPYTFREYVANRMIEQIENGEYELKENKETNMNKKLIRLTESDLHRIVKESVNRVLNEIGDTNRGQYMLGRLAGRKYANNYNTNGYDESGKIANYAQQQRQYKSVYNPYTSGYDNGFEGKDGQEGYDYYKKMDADDWQSKRLSTQA